WASTCGERSCGLIRAFRATGPASRSSIATATAGTGSKSAIRTKPAAASPPASSTAARWPSTPAWSRLTTTEACTGWWSRWAGEPDAREVKNARKHPGLTGRQWLARRGSDRTPAEAAASPQEAPLRAQLFSAEQMERHGRVLAQAHRLSGHRSAALLLARLSANEAVIERASRLLSEAAHAKRRLTPAGDWLLDNLYLIEEQVRIARRHLPKGYSRELPRLDGGPSDQLPRVYDIALNAISHGDGRVDVASLDRFIAAYQSVTPLTLGELWAIPIMLRLALIENLRRVSVQVIAGRIDRDLADLWGDRFTEMAESDPKSVVLVIADMARSQPPASSAFVAEIVRRLQGQGAALALPLTWIEQWLADHEQGIAQMVQLENRQQAADQVSISNSIGSLRLLSMTDWREFVETVSVVEKILRDDPAAIYGRMDFATRDRYR